MFIDSFVKDRSSMDKSAEFGRVLLGVETQLNNEFGIHHGLHCMITLPLSESEMGHRWLQARHSPQSQSCCTKWYLIK